MLSTITLLAAEGHEPNGAWLPHDINEVIWGTITFLIVLGILYWKGAPFVKKAMVDRTARIATQLTDAESDRTGAEAERDRITAALADSDSEAARIVEEARQTADRLATDLGAKAHADAATLRDRAAADLESTRRQAVADLTAEVSRLALGAAEQVVTSNLDDVAQQQLIEQYISQVGATN